jgi:hypothetical protein
MKEGSLFNIILLVVVFFAPLQSQIQYLFPIPNSDYHTKETVLVLRFENTSPKELTNFHTFITVTGERSGSVSGTTIECLDKKTINFKSNRSFLPGEMVTVHMNPKKMGYSRAFLDTVFQFKISDDVSIQQPVTPLYHITQSNISNPNASLGKSDGLDPIIRNGISIPSDFPWVNISINENPDTGYIFLNNWGGPPYNMILNNDGNPIWYWKTEDRQRDFKVQPDGRLTMRVRSGYGGGGHIALDSSYAIVDTFFAPPGYVVDEHELQVFPNGNYLLIVLEWRIENMSLIVPGGNPSAVITGNHLVEMDANDNQIFIWRCWDNFEITDAIHENLTANNIDYVHMNAIEVDLDGNLLVSSRHMDEITKINRLTGEIIWRLGGRNDDFAWDDADRISYQHDIRVLPNGNYTVFDNGNFHQPGYSRALELQIDTLYWTVSKEWQYRDSPDKFTWWMGNVQRLPSGNTLINWADGSLPKITEVRTDGSKALELNFENGAHCYRVFKFPWKGVAKIPYLMVEPYFDRITLLFNKFGDEDIAYYNIYGSVTPQPTDILATSEEPFVHLFDLDNLNNYYFRVTAVNSSGEESDYSNEEMIYVRIIPPGDNMIINGDFSEGSDYWDFYVNTSEANASHFVPGSEEIEIEISDGGSEYWHVQTLYPNLTLLEGHEYLFEFDAYASENRLIEAEIKKNGSPWTNYSRIGLTYLTEIKEHFSHQFTMSEPNEFQARVEFNVGADNGDVFIDNVSLKEVVTGINHPDIVIPTTYKLNNNFPNPFNPITTISYQVPDLSYVSIIIYNVLGEKLETLINLQHGPGIHEIVFDGSKYSSGVYYYQMMARSLNGSISYNQVKKMMLIK